MHQFEGGNRVIANEDIYFQGRHDEKPYVVANQGTILVVRNAGHPLEVSPISNPLMSFEVQPHQIYMWEYLTLDIVQGYIAMVGPHFAKLCGVEDAFMPRTIAHMNRPYLPTDIGAGISVWRQYMPDCSERRCWLLFVCADQVFWNSHENRFFWARDNYQKYLPLIQQAEQLAGF